MKSIIEKLKETINRDIGQMDCEIKRLNEKLKGWENPNDTDPYSNEDYQRGLDLLNTPMVVRDLGLKYLEIINEEMD